MRKMADSIASVEDISVDPWLDETGGDENSISQFVAFGIGSGGGGSIGGTGGDNGDNRPGNVSSGVGVAAAAREEPVVAVVEPGADSEVGAGGLMSGTPSGKKKQKDLNSYNSSIERNVWSTRNAIWRKCATSAFVRSEGGGQRYHRDRCLVVWMRRPSLRHASKPLRNARRRGSTTRAVPLSLSC